MTFNLNFGAVKGAHIELITNFVVSAIDKTPIQEFDEIYLRLKATRDSRSDLPTFEEVVKLMSSKGKTLLSQYPAVLITRISNGTMYGKTRGRAPITDRYIYLKNYTPSSDTIIATSSFTPSAWTCGIDPTGSP